MEDEERGLVTRIVQHNDQQAYRIIYRKYAAEILRRLHRLLGRKDTAEDCLQQVFLEAYRSLPQFRGDSSLRTWLHRITERVAFAQYKKDKRSHSFLRQWKEKGRELPSPPQPGDRLEKTQLHAWMQPFIERLAPKKRLVLVLCDLEQKPYDEVAAIVETTEGTVASRLHHARKELRTMLERALQRQGLSYGDLFNDE